MIVQRLNRHQNTNNVVFCDVSTGKSKVVYTDKDEAWLDVVDDLLFFKKGQSFTWVSQKGGWNSAYQISRNGKSEKRITPSNFDVISVKRIDTLNGYIYYIASPDNATESYLYRNQISAPNKPERLTPVEFAGCKNYDISLNGKWELHSWSDANTPYTKDLISLSDHKVVKSVMDNRVLK